MIRITNIKLKSGETAGKQSQINLAQKIKKMLEKSRLEGKVKVSA